MIGPLEAGIDPCSPGISCEFAGPCFEANVLHTEVDGNIAWYPFHFQYDVSGPLVQQDHSTKQVLEITQSVNVVFSSDRSGDRFTGKPVSQTTGLYVLPPLPAGRTRSCAHQFHLTHLSATVQRTDLGFDCNADQVLVLVAQRNFRCRVFG